MKLQDKVTKSLISKDLSIAVAESCTAGYLSYLLTQTSGSSKVFRGAIVCYSLQSKRFFLKIPKTLLKSSQGVSKKVSSLLALRIKNLFNSDIGVAVVGFSGPQTKRGVKVGTTYIAIAYQNKLIAKKEVFSGSRDQVRKKSSNKALELIYSILKTKV